MFNGREILFKNVDIDNIVYVFIKQADRLTKKDDGCMVRSCYEAEGDTQGFDGSMGSPRIFLNNDNYGLGHQELFEAR